MPLRASATRLGLFDYRILTVRYNKTEAFVYTSASEQGKECHRLQTTSVVEKRRDDGQVLTHVTEIEIQNESERRMGRRKAQEPAALFDSESE
jgi:hypothetical protein